jgi:hypothetical protein
VICASREINSANIQLNTPQSLLSAADNQPTPFSTRPCQIFLVFGKVGSLFGAFNYKSYVEIDDIIVQPFGVVQYFYIYPGDIDVEFRDDDLVEGK